MSTSTLSLATALLVGITAHGAEVGQTEFRVRREVSVPAIAEDTLFSVTLDADFFDATRVGFPDVQLRTADGHLVPFVIRTAKSAETRTVRNTWRPEKLTAKPFDDIAGRGLEVVVHLEDDDPQPTGLSLITPLRNFEQRVRVDSSTDGTEWQPLGQESVVFDYSRYIDVRNVEVPVPETAHRHFRIRIDDVTVEQESQLLELTRRLRGQSEQFRQERIRINRVPFRIDRIDFWREAEQQIDGETKRVVYPPANLQISKETTKGSRTLLLVTTHREPLTEFRVQTASRNFSRPAAVQIMQNGRQEEWADIGSATLSRIDFQGLEREQLRIQFSESRRDKYRIVIENQDSPPLEVTSVEPRGSVYELVFVGSPQEQYALVYGNPEVEAASFDTAVIRELLSQGFDPTQASLGEPDRIVVAPAAPSWTDLLSNAWFLFAVATVLVVILGFGLYQATKRVDELVTNQSEP